MNELLKLVSLGFRSHTVYSHIQILVIIISRLVSFRLLQYTNVREAFSCVPKPNATIEQLCYHNYTSSYNQSYEAVFNVDCGFYFAWIMFAVYFAFVVRNIKRNRQGQGCPWRKAADYRGVYIVFIGIRFFGIFGMAIISGVSVSVPSPYRCSLSNDTAPISLNQTENVLFCHDQRYKAKTNLNISLLTVNLFNVGLCITDALYVAFIPLEKFLYEVLGANIPTSCELPAMRYSVNSLQETPSSSGDPVINCESSVTECGTQNVENTSCDQSHSETADGHTHDNVLVPSPGSDRRYLLDWQEN